LSALPRVAEARIRRLNEAAPRADARWVLYWMTAFRRHHDNFALDRALEWCADLGLPLLILEPLRCGHRWASDRIHAFVTDGMAERAEALRDAPVRYIPYVEPHDGAGRGLLAALARDAAVVVTDDWPCFFLPRAQAAAARALDCPLEAVDANGLLPLAAAPQAFARAVDLRRFLQRELRPWLERPPRRAPLARAALPPAPALPRALLARWPAADPHWLADPVRDLSALPIDHAVAPVSARGGESAAATVLKRFLDERLHRYAESRADPCQAAASGLAPWLHFGMLATHRVLDALAKREDWSPQRFGAVRNGAKEGGWGMSAPAESFLDEIVTWRELGHLFCQRRPADYDRYASLPEWARATLERHARDPRDPLYTPAQLEAAATHDEVWNAAQRQLVREGGIHNYLRMLWGKKILEWSASPQAALDVMIHLNNKYALDGRDPNSYSGIFWTLGRFDRPWAPERPVFGTIRYMSSDNTRRKLPLKEYLERYGPTTARG
jgi:deoxyribodipyrimidine photo-lyase